MKFNVNMFVVIGIKVRDVEAESHAAAIAKAREHYNLTEIFDSTCGGIETHYPDEPHYGYLVDVVGDAEYEQSMRFRGDGVTVDNFTGCAMCGALPAVRAGELAAALSNLLHQASRPPAESVQDADNGFTDAAEAAEDALREYRRATQHGEFAVAKPKSARINGVPRRGRGI